MNNVTQGPQQVSWAPGFFPTLAEVENLANQDFPGLSNDQVAVFAAPIAQFAPIALCRKGDFHPGLFSLPEDEVDHLKTLADLTRDAGDKDHSLLELESVPRDWSEETFDIKLVQSLRPMVRLDAAA